MATKTTPQNPPSDASLIEIKSDNIQSEEIQTLAATVGRNRSNEEAIAATLQQNPRLATHILVADYYRSLTTILIYRPDLINQANPSNLPYFKPEGPDTHKQNGYFVLGEAFLRLTFQLEQFAIAIRFDVAYDETFADTIWSQILRIGQFTANTATLFDLPPEINEGQAIALEFKDRVALIANILHRAFLPLVAAYVEQQPAIKSRLQHKPQPRVQEAIESAITAIDLYTVDDLNHALGPDATDLHPAEDPNTKPDQINHILINRLIRSGQSAARRALVHADENHLQSIAGLEAKAPHLLDLIDVYKRQIKLSINIGQPLRAPPILLRGKPGTGKTWLLSRLAEALGVPFRKYPMSGASIAATFQGSNPIYRNAQPGLVAKTLMSETIANPVMLIDEFDKPAQTEGRADPYRPFYTLFERESAASFVDEFLQFPLRADGVMWIATANETSGIPDAILDRLKIIDVPEITTTQMRSIMASIYAQTNQLHQNWFDPTYTNDIETQLIDMAPRQARIAIEDAMATAGANNRRTILATDIVRDAKQSKGFGFISKR